MSFWARLKKEIDRKHDALREGFDLLRQDSDTKYEDLKSEFANVKYEFGDVKRDTAYKFTEARKDTGGRFTDLKNEVTIKSALQLFESKMKLYFLILFFEIILINSRAMDLVARLIGLIK